MMIKVGVRDDHTTEARSARRPGRAASAGTAFAGQPVTQTLNPPPPSFETCKTVGKRVICDGARTESYGPDDTGIACGSGAGAFDIFDQGTYNQHAIRFYHGWQLNPACHLRSATGSASRANGSRTRAVLASAPFREGTQE
jgi:hypothetical protein